MQAKVNKNAEKNVTWLSIAKFLYIKQSYTSDEVNKLAGRILQDYPKTIY